MWKQKYSKNPTKNQGEYLCTVNRIATFVWYNQTGVFVARMKILPTPSLKAAARVFALAAVLLFSVAAYPATIKKFTCGNVSDVIRENMQDGYAFLSVAVTQQTLVVEFFINMNTGEWRMIGVDEDLNACTLMTGTDWQFALLREI